ncbi:unnamed protein product [Amoebophrya sp. A25]|nr:unnamed protein product [Amoebophrya sp. A25]|eukprot:GSA25T00005884001.1
MLSTLRGQPRLGGALSGRNRPLVGITCCTSLGEFLGQEKRASPRGGDEHVLSSWCTDSSVTFSGLCSRSTASSSQQRRGYTTFGGEDFFSDLYDARKPLASYTPKAAANVKLTSKEFVKKIRKCHGLYETVYDEILAELDSQGHSSPAAEASVLSSGLMTSGSSASSSSTLSLSHKSRSAFFESLMANMVFPKHVHRYFMKAANGASLFPSCIYTHGAAGLGDYCLEATAKRDGSNVDVDQRNIQDALRFVTYYRSPLMLEELHRMGYETRDIHRLVAKAMFMQFHAGDPFGPKKDPYIFSSMTRKFYPCESHVSTGSTDLGRDLEMQAARAFCMGTLGVTPPVTVIASGDTGMYTDGAMHAIAHLVEARERGYAMPLIFLIHANNSSISSRVGRDDGSSSSTGSDYGLKKLVERFESYRSLIDPGFVSWAPDVAGGIESMQRAVDQVCATGRPTYVITRFPFRPGGHANDQNPAPDAVVVDQFAKLKDCLLHQLALGCGSAATCGEIKDALESTNASIGGEVDDAILGRNFLTRSEALELSQPGVETALKQEKGRIFSLPAGYLLGELQGVESTGMGSDLFAKAINAEMDKADAAGRPCRYVHQENHLRSKAKEAKKEGTSGTVVVENLRDSRGGVYGELNLVKEKHLAEKFVNFLPHESGVVQVGAAFRSVAFPSTSPSATSKAVDPLVFVKGPHTIFNEHARDHMKYAAYRFCDSGTAGNVIYMFDGGSIANFDADSGHWLARVGEHHNTPEYASYASDANTVLALPLDMNAFQLNMKEMVRLHDLGRMVVCVVPTTAFQKLHTRMELQLSEGDNDDAVTPTDDGNGFVLGVNDMIRVNLSSADDAPSKASNSSPKRNLVVLGWGPESKMVVKALREENVTDCDFFVLAYNRAPNSLVRFLEKRIDDLKVSGGGDDLLEILVVDGNPNAGLLGPVITDLKRKMGPRSARQLRFTECTIPSTYIPYGLGDSLMQVEDVRKSIQQISEAQNKNGQCVSLRLGVVPKALGSYSS